MSIRSSSSRSSSARTESSLRDRRVVFVDAEFLGVLRQDLADTLGMDGAHGILSRLGYAEGWLAAEARPPEAAASDGPRDAWLDLLRKRGFVSAPDEPAWAGDQAEASLSRSVEAEQHARRFGPSAEAVCWLLAGFVSGYLSRVHDRAVLCLESECLGKGDPRCRLVARPLEDWAETEQAAARFYDPVRLDSHRETSPGLEPEMSNPAAPESASAVPGLVRTSPVTARVFELAKRAAMLDSPVLLTGESGAGKETLAREIHAASGRAARPFVRVNCAEVPEILLEAELFGYAAAAFPGAPGERIGYLEAADGGTLFLSGIDELTGPTQAKLLRYLDAGTFRRLGETVDRRADVRLLAACGADLQAAMRAGKIRDDLYHRVAVIRIDVPPLRDRREDILPLAQAHLEDIARSTGRGPRTFTPRAAHQLARYAWPGNIRELRNAIKHAATVAAGEGVELTDLPNEVRESAPAEARKPRSRPLAEIERSHILDVLEAAKGNRALTARILGIGPATLFRKLRAYAEAPASGGGKPRGARARRAKTRPTAPR